MAVAYKKAATLETEKKITQKKPSSTSQPAPYTFVLRFLDKCHGSVRRCFGCYGKFRQGTEYPEAPGDLIVVSQMLRSYKKDNKQQNGKVSPVYFHANSKCISKIDAECPPRSVNVGTEMKENLHQHTESCQKSSLQKKNSKSYVIAL